MRRMVVTLTVLGLSLFLAISASAQVGGGGGCWQCVPNPNGGYGCNGDQMIGWDGCTPGATCNHGAECGIAGSCFLAGTLVATPDGDISIEDLRVGDQVLSQTDGGTIVHSRVTRTYHAIEIGYYVINEAISVTASHPVLVADQWVLVEALVVGDVVTGQDSQPVKVESISKVDVGVRVYNIEVDGTHTFFADGILVHNKDPHPNG